MPWRRLPPSWPDGHALDLCPFCLCSLELRYGCDWCNLSAGHLVQATRQARMAPDRPAICPGVDGALCIDRIIGLDGLARNRHGGRSNPSHYLRCPASPQRRVDADFFRTSSTRDGAGGNSPALGFYPRHNRSFPARKPGCRRAARSLPGMGEFCDRTQLFHMAAQPLTCRCAGADEHDACDNVDDDIRVQTRPAPLTEQTA